jgi:hypothetical protein
MAVGGTVRMVLGRTDIMLKTTVGFGVFRVIAAPLFVTAVCIAVFREITQVSPVGERAQLLLAGTFALAGIAASGLAQPASLLNEMAVLKWAKA